MNEPTSGNRSVSVISFEEAAELDAALSKSRDSQSSIFFSPDNYGLGEAENRQKEKQVMLTIRRKRAETRACSRSRVRRTTPANMRRCYL